MPEFYDQKREPDCVDFSAEDDVPRANIERHFVQEDDGTVIAVMPGCDFTIGDLRDPRTGYDCSIIRIRSQAVPVALAMPLVPAELRALGKLMIERAEAQEARAAHAAREALDRALKGGEK
jgi:hypothetical protein